MPPHLRHDAPDTARCQHGFEHRETRKVLGVGHVLTAPSSGVQALQPNRQSHYCFAGNSPPGYRSRSALVLESQHDRDLAAIAGALELVETKWHDGLVHAVTLEGTRDATSCVLDVSIYASEQAWDPLTAIFVNVTVFEASARADQLRDHWTAGNIEAAVVRRIDSGYLEFQIRVVEGGPIRVVAQASRAERSTT
jgi:hypothetical protein